MRQVQQHYPPYPHHVGVHQIHPPPGVPFGHASSSSATKSRPQMSHTAPRLGGAAAKRNPAGNNRRTPSILKHYKSCPVSPVHEEVEWSAETDRVLPHTVEPKRHSVYADDARTILDMIHADTEKMIDEITRKYGDLDDAPTAAPLPASCSMPANLRALDNSTGESTPTATPPRGGRTQYYVYREIYQCERKVSLSDILQPELFAASQQRLDEARFLETQRHSSASFFLSHTGQLPHDSHSQESLLSDGGSYCNSLESVLSDESDCKSAPSLDPPLDTTRPMHAMQCHAGIRNFILHGPVSKSYGNSPNAYGSFDYYMRQQTTTGSSTYDSFDVTGYNLNPLKPLPSSKTYPRLASMPPGGGGATAAREHIPTMRSKNKQYNSGVNKSLSTDFAQQRQQRNSNPLAHPAGNTELLFVRKPLKPKPPIPAKPQNLVSTLTSSVEKKTSRTASVVRQFEHNLQKFEREKQRAQQRPVTAAMRSSVSSGALATHSCLKKVSRFDTSESGRRATSVRQKARPKISVRFNTVSQIKYTPSAKRQQAKLNDAEQEEDEDVEATMMPLVGSLPSDYGGERSFEMYFAENGNAPENMEHMQSLKLYTKPQLQAVVDEIQQERAKHKKNMDNVVERCHGGGGGGNSTSHQCQNIAKKIDIIEKLIAMEERKMEQIRLATETRLRPFACNSKQKGYVKSLTMNFDMLAQQQQQQQMSAEAAEQETISSDADLCAYARHIRRNCSLPDVLESADFVGYGNDVELAREVIADDDGDAADNDDDDDVDDDRGILVAPPSSASQQENKIDQRQGLSAFLDDPLAVVQ